MPQTNKIRVLIVDDSALTRSVLKEVFETSRDIEVVGSAADPLEARKLIKQLNPDVLTLDIEMPHMDGLTFLSNLMRLRPMPVVMVSSLTENDADATLRALQLGAVDFVSKPKLNAVQGFTDFADEIIGKVRIASYAQISRPNGIENHASAPIATMDKNRTSVSIQQKESEKIIAVGASTGGTEAIKALVKDLPLTTPAIVVSQHLPRAFSESFARHVDQASEMTACIARDGEPILSGNIYIAPGDRHLRIVRNGVGFVCQLDNGPAVNRHKPAVDVMFESVARYAGCDAIGVLMTGMGADGAIGIKTMHDVGSSTIIQDEATSVVWGMPGEALKLGGVDRVVPLHLMAQIITELI